MFLFLLCTKEATVEENREFLLGMTAQQTPKNADSRWCLVHLLCQHLLRFFFSLGSPVWRQNNLEVCLDWNGYSLWVWHLFCFTVDKWDVVPHIYFCIDRWDNLVLRYQQWLQTFTPYASGLHFTKVRKVVHIWFPAPPPPQQKYIDVELWI